MIFLLFVRKKLRQSKMTRSCKKIDNSNWYIFKIINVRYFVFISIDVSNNITNVTRLMCRYLHCKRWIIIHRVRVIFVIMSNLVVFVSRKKKRYSSYPGVSLKIQEGHLKIIFLWKRWLGTSGANSSLGKEISTFARQSAWRWKYVDRVKGTHWRRVVVPSSA